MTIHRAKGLEFPVVCVADLGRLGAAAAPRAAGRPRRQRRAAAGAARRRRAGAGARLGAARRRGGAADAEEERRLFYVAMTRARERLILSGGIDCERWPEPRPGGPPIDWIARALAGDPRSAFAAPETVVERALGRPAGAACAACSTRPRRSTSCCRARRCAPAGRPRAGAPATALPAPPAVRAAPRRRGRGPRRSGSPTRSLGDYARCGYRFYLRRRPRLPPVDAAATPRGRAAASRRSTPTRARLDRPRAARGARLRPPGRAGSPPRSSRWPASAGVELTDAEVEDIRALVGAFADLAAVRSAWRRRARIAPRGRRSRSRSTRRAAARSSPASSTCSPASPTARVLIVDYKTDRLEGADTRATSSSATTRPSGSSTRSPRCATARRAPRSPTASSSAPASPSRARSPPPTRPPSRSASPASRAACSTQRYPVTAAPAPRAVRRLPGAGRAVLVVGGHDAARAAGERRHRGRHAQSSPAPWPGAPARRTLSRRMRRPPQVDDRVELGAEEQDACSSARAR